MHENHEYDAATTQKPVVPVGGARKIVLLASGAFNPPTFMHFRMFERAKDFLERTLSLEVLEGVVSPCSDYGANPDLVASIHRLKMVELIASGTDWISTDAWESEQRGHIRVLDVLRHVQTRMEKKYGPEKLRVMLLCGGDVMESFAKISPEVDMWRTSDLTEIVRHHGIVVISRVNTNPMRIIYMIDLLREFQKNIYVIEDETFASALSSTKLRTAIRRNESIKFCTDDQVISYISQFGLYKPEKPLQEASVPSAAKENLSASVKEGAQASTLKRPTREVQDDTKNNLPKLENDVSAEPIWCGQATTSQAAPSSLESECTQTTITLESPIYDNVSFEEIVKASNSWKEYIKSVAEQTSTSVLEQIRRLEEQHSQSNVPVRQKQCQDRSTQYQVPSTLTKKEHHTDGKKLIRFDLKDDRGGKPRKTDEARVPVPLVSAPAAHSLTSTTTSRSTSPRQFGTPSDSGITLTYADCPLDSNTPETTV
uniref:Nicotinamide/nicotinic acid mononucleotide adenylyltransferase 3 n=1 Tax=Steinernema glaseri TaxID=37863 RepID=A0A1I8ANI3_9BILA